MGDPHFLGFNGTRWDYHGTPGNWHLLFADGSGLKVRALFALGGAMAAQGSTFVLAVSVVAGTKAPAPTIVNATVETAYASSGEPDYYPSGAWVGGWRQRVYARTIRDRASAAS